MALLLQQIFSGVATGGIYALLALALVVGRLAIGHINFAQAEIATFSTFIAWILIGHGVTYWAAFMLTIGISIVGGILLERIVYRPVERADIFTQLIVFVGLLIFFNGLSGWFFDYLPKVFPSPFTEVPFFQNKFIAPHELGMLLVTIMVTLCFTLFFQFTKLGLCIRASSKDPQLSRISGIHVGKMLALAWGLSAGIGAIAGMLIAPIVFLDPNMMEGILLYAMTATVLGGIDSMVGVMLGGILVGIAENLIGTYIPFVGNELKLPVVLLILIIVLLFLPNGIMGKRIIKRL